MKMVIREKFINKRPGKREEGTKEGKVGQEEGKGKGEERGGERREGENGEWGEGREGKGFYFSCAGCN